MSPCGKCFSNYSGPIGDVIQKIPTAIRTSAHPVGVRQAAEVPRVRLPKFRPPFRTFVRPAR